jgi:dihydroxy-acid dehydratase
VPTLVNLMPTGRYLMEDFCYAGGIPAVMRELGDLLHTSHVGVTGQTMAQHIADAQCWNSDVIRSVATPLQPPGSGTAVLHGNLCPGGAVIKQSAASPQLLKHRGQALVFDSIEEYHQAAGLADLPADESTILVVRGAGPKGYPGMPEIGNFVLPSKLLARGVTDMVRISDARMSGTGFGTVVLHVAPEAVLGGPLALVRTGDWIELDVPARTLTLQVDDDELARRRADWAPPCSPHRRGYARLYVEHVLQADQGADLDFLVGASGAGVPRHNH